MVVALTRAAPYAVQPTNRVVWPEEGAPWWSSFSGGIVWDVESAIRSPAVSRATRLYTELIRQCAMDAYRGTVPLPRPRLLDRPDPTRSRSWFVGVMVEDYLWHGNALAQVTDRNAEGWPAAVAWLPAAWTSVVTVPGRGITYHVGDRDIDPRDVVHVRRGADRHDPVKGLGVIQQHLATFSRAALEEEYERTALTRSGVPSVVVTSPNPYLSQDEADAADATWEKKQAVRKPVFLPYGTTVTPLGWSPADSQMVEARKMSLQDVANCFNLDGFWLGAPSASLTYKSPAPMFVAHLRTALEGVLADFEQTWADDWLPRGTSIRFDRLQLTRDDFAGQVDALSKAIAPPQSSPDLPALFTTEEARLYMGLAASDAAVPSLTSPLTTEEGPP